MFINANLDKVRKGSVTKVAGKMYKIKITSTTKTFNIPNLIGSPAGRTEPELSTDSGDLLFPGADWRAHKLPGGEEVEAAVVLQGGHVL